MTIQGWGWISEKFWADGVHTAILKACEITYIQKAGAAKVEGHQYTIQQQSGVTVKEGWGRERERNREGSRISAFRWSLLSVAEKRQLCLRPPFPTVRRKRERERETWVSIVCGCRRLPECSMCEIFPLGLWNLACHTRKLPADFPGLNDANGGLSKTPLRQNTAGIKV